MANCEKIDLTEALKKLPKWFLSVAGFRYRDPEGDTVIVIGEGGWRKANPVSLSILLNNKKVASEITYNLDFMSWTLVGCYNYKGEWHMFDILAQSAENWEYCRPL